MLIELAKKERDAAATAMAAAARDLEAAERQLSLLHDYRADYLRRQSDALAQGAQADLARSYRQFIERIDVAVAQQEAEVARCRSQLAAAQEQLGETQRRVASFEALLARRTAEAQIAQLRTEQKQSDEIANQTAARSTVAWTNAR